MIIVREENGGPIEEKTEAEFKDSVAMSDDIVDTMLEKESPYGSLTDPFAIVKWHWGETMSDLPDHIRDALS